MEIGTGSGSGYGVRCTPVAVWLKLWSAALQLCSSAARVASTPVRPLDNCPSTPFPGMFPGTPSGTGTGACLWARLCVLETQPSVETARVETTRRPKPAQTSCPRNHHHFRLQPQHPSSAALIPPATRLARVAPQATGGRRPCLVVQRVPCAEIGSRAKKRKNKHIFEPRNNGFSPAGGGLGGKRRLPHEFCTL